MGIHEIPSSEKSLFDHAKPVIAKVADKFAVPGETIYMGGTIAKDGVYSHISLDDYHGNRKLLDGPSVSKSMLKWLLPAHGGSPKAFWGRWGWNENRIEQESSDALDFGKAAHCLLLGDEDFNKRFAIRPDEYPDSKTGELKPWSGKSNWCKAWLEARAKDGKTIISSEQYDRIGRISADAKQYPLVEAGIIHGAVERSMFWKDPETGIWLKARPDVIPQADGVFADLKTAAKFDEDFLERQIFDASYYLQAAITRMVCRGLGLPFETFTLLYVLNDDVPDTAHVEIDDFDIDRGERVIRWCLRTIRRCLDSGEWPGARPFNDGERRIQMKPWAKERLDNFLQREQAA
jgi:hypothetical protein